MKSKVVLLKAALPLTTSLTLLVACGPAPTTPSPNPTASGTATPAPSDSPAATPTPTAVPTDVPTASPSASATATAVPSASASATSNPLPSATSDISVVERTTFNGKAFDDTEAPLDGVTVTAKSLNSTLPFEATTTTAGGAYAFNNAPAGVQIEISASKPGFTTRRRVEVLKSNKDGDPNANKYDFGAGSGSNGTLANALSDKPEVVAVTPGRNASGVSPNTSFVLKFSEPMDRATVVDSFLVRAFTTEQLSVDNQNTVNGSNSIADPTGTSIWDKAAFNVSWNSDDSEATFTFKEERALPTDKDSDKVPDYAVTFSKGGFIITAPAPINNSIKDKTGISRNSDYFKLTEGNFEQSYKFTITTDTTKPRLDSIVAQTDENSGATSEGDVIRVRFNERMVHYTLDRTIAGGINKVASQAAGAVTDSQTPADAISAEAAAGNYKVTVLRGATTMLTKSSWSSLGGRAIFDTTDPTHKTVLLLPGTQTNLRTIQGSPAGLPISVTHVYTDGTSETITTPNVATNNLSDAGLTLVNTVDPQSGTYGGRYNDVDSSNTLNLNDTYFLTLGAGARQNDNNPATANGKLIAYTIINPTGAFGPTALNAPAGGYVLFPGNAAGGRPDLYKPGDNIVVEADTTIVDPAGNTLDSAGDDASANAS